MDITDKNNLPKDSSKDNIPDPQNTKDALRQAEKDISNDPDLSAKPDPAADLDEGELARLEGEG